MIKVYGSVKCPYCMVLKENLDRNSVTYDFIEILENLGNLGSFLALRDSDPVFDHLKAVKDIGVPALVDENGKVWTDWESWLKENGYEIFIPEASLSQACSLDRKGC
ncbi:MAG TPA: glutaredoxin [Erysipelotrichaceae bacterium]|nr:glutaredoxin [Erysipelotrichaceae bacterium]